MYQTSNRQALDKEMDTAIIDQFFNYNDILFDVEEVINVNIKEII